MVRARDQHDAAVGGLVLVLPALPRSEERRRRAGSERGVRRVDAGRPLRRRRRARGAAPALRALLAQGALRPRPREARRAVHEARAPGDDPRRHRTATSRRSKATSASSPGTVEGRCGRRTRPRSASRETNELVEEKWAQDAEVEIKDNKTFHKTLGVEVVMVAEKMTQVARQRRQPRRHREEPRRRRAPPLRDVHGPARGGEALADERASRACVASSTARGTSAPNVTDDAAATTETQPPRPQDDQEGHRGHRGACASTPRSAR